MTRAWVSTVTGRTVATARLLLCPFACCTPLFSEEIEQSLRQLRAILQLELGVATV